MEKNQKQIFDLAHYAFQFEKNETYQNRLDYLVNHSTHYGSYDGNQLVSQIIATPFKVQLFHQLFDMMGIGFVSSDPAYRGEGRIDQLMTQILSDCKENGMTLSYLAPFSYPFYRRYGYELVFERIAYQVPSHQWPDSKRVVGKIRRLSWEDAKSSVQSIYTTSNRNKHGGVLREDWWYEYKFQLQRSYYFAVYYNSENQPEGYLAYQIKEGIFYCQEWEALTGNAYLALNRYIATHKDSVKEIHYERGYDKDTVFFLNETPFFEATIRPEMMVRIVDVEKFLQKYPLDNLSQSVAIRIEKDLYATWNEGIFELDAKVKKVKKVKTSKLPTLTLSVQRLTQLLLGYKTIQELLFFDFISVDSEIIEVLEAILPKNMPVLEDYF